MKQGPQLWAKGPFPGIYIRLTRVYLTFEFETMLCRTTWLLAITEILYAGVIADAERIY